MSNHSSQSNSSSKKSRKTYKNNELSTDGSSRGHENRLTPSIKAANNSIMMDVSSIERDPRAHSHSMLSLDDSMDSILHSPAPRTSTPLKKERTSRTSRKSQSLYKRALINQAETVPRPQKEITTQSRSRSRVRIPPVHNDSSNYDTAPESLNSTRATNEESYRSHDATQRELFSNLRDIDRLNRLASTKPSMTDLSNMAKCVLITPLSVHTSQEVNVIAVTGQILITSQTLIRSSRASTNIRVLMDTLLTSTPAIRNESNKADIDHENEKSIHKVFVGDDSILIERVSTIHRGRDRNSFNTDDRRTYRFVCHGDLLTNDPVSQAKPRYLTVHAETSTSKDINEIEKSERIVLAFDKSSSTKTFNHSQAGISLVKVNVPPSEGPVVFDEHVRVSELSHINIVRNVNINSSYHLWNEPRTELREKRVYKQQNVASIDDDVFEPAKIVRSQSITRTRGVNKKKNESILGPLRDESNTEKRSRPSVERPRPLSADPSSRRRISEQTLPRSRSTDAMDRRRNGSSNESSRKSRKDVQLQFPYKISSADEDTSAGSSASSSEQLRTPTACSPKLETSVTTLTHNKQSMEDDCDRLLDVTQHCPSPTPKNRDIDCEFAMRNAVPADYRSGSSTHEPRSTPLCGQIMKKNASSIRTLPASGRVLKSTVSLTGMDNRESFPHRTRRALSVDQMPFQHLQYPKAPSPPLPPLVDKATMHKDENITDYNSHRPVPRPRTTNGRSRIPPPPPVSPADRLTPSKMITPSSAPPIPAPSISRPPITVPHSESKIMDKSSHSNIQKKNVEIVSNPEDYDQGEIMTKKLTLDAVINGHTWLLCVNFFLKADRASEISFIPKRIVIDDKALWEETENWTERTMDVTNTTTGPRTIGRSSSEYEHSVQVQAPSIIDESLSTIGMIGGGSPVPSINSTQSTPTSDLSISQITVVSKHDGIISSTSSSSSSKKKRTD